ncbi:MAG: hypothetical protein K2X97_14855 [Mycobacteriaceae bacterium]|nr:hypothetical protein [Mycobacteriaceae bacterium]
MDRPQSPLRQTYRANDVVERNIASHAGAGESRRSRREFGSTRIQPYVDALRYLVQRGFGAGHLFGNGRCVGNHLRRLGLVQLDDQCGHFVCARAQFGGNGAQHLLPHPVCDRVPQRPPLGLHVGRIQSASVAIGSQTSTSF